MKLSAAAAILLAACTVPAATRVDPDALDQPDVPLADAGVDAPADGAPDAMLAVAMLSAQPSTDAAFGDVVLGQTSGAQSYTINNDGDLASGAIAITVDDAAAGFALASDTCSGAALAGHHSCTFGVTFAPAAAGAHATTLRVIGDPGGEVDRDLGGTGLAPGAIDLVEHGWDFGDRGVDAGAFKHTFDVTNGGQVAIAAPQIAIGGATDAYFLDATTCTLALAPAAHCTVTVRFDPATVGDKPGSLTVTSTTGGSDAAALSGTGVAHVTVTRAGTGTGSVASNQPGIDCGATCDADFSSTPVTLEATTPIGATFTGWSGDCTGAGSCTLDLTGAKHVTATFAAITPTLTVTKIGNGSGTIVSSPNGIACGAACAASFAYAASVTLTATPAAGSTFAGWSGACAGTGPCVVTMDQARGVAAEFDAVTPPLVVAIDGTGTGSVTSKPDGIACAPTCTASYGYGAIVVLTAAPSVGTSFTGWSGACAGTNPTCTITLDQERDVTATFDAIRPTLTVARAGTALGTISSAPSGIACGVTCSAQFGFAAVVTLTATPDAGQQLTSWSGACTGTAPTCTVSMDQARSATATFAAFTPTLTVTRAGTGTGTVASTGAGIACGSTCAHAYTYGDTVMLTATAATGATFTGWSGACAGTAATCTVTMDQAQNAIATFDALTPEVDVSLIGLGAGTVSSVPAGITCGSACSASFTFGTSVTLTASAATGSTFAGWGGACAGNATSTCTVVADRARAVTAQFDPVTPPLTVALAGNGGGKVTSAPAAIDCGTACTSTFAYGQSVTLTPTATTGSTFSGWSGACSGTGACVVTMTAARSVTATFVLNVFNLTTAAAGNGSGAIALSPSGTSCGAGCASFTYGATVVITATAAAGSAFTGWAGDCSGTATSCTLTIDRARSATATFTLQTFPITITTVGSGTVTPSPAGVACGAGCASYSYGTSVTLTEAASTGSTFTGWSGAGSGACANTNPPTCTVTVDQARAITATFTINIYDLVVTTAGAGTGTVSLAPGGASCGTGCTAYPYGSSVTLSANAGAGSTFAGWSGSGAGTCVGQTTSCTLTIDQQRAVTATFTLNSENLQLTTTGNGSISQSVGGASCGAGCSSYAYGTSLTLTANASLGSTFAGWSGDAGTCTGTSTATCTIVMDRPRAITATFAPIAEKLTWAATGAGSGTIATSPTGVACGTGCATYDYGTSVVVTATPAAGATFAGWSGACTNATGTCTVSMTQMQSVTARFDAVQVQLTWSDVGTGSGAVALSPPGASCGSTCASFAYGTSVTLTATPSTGSTFNGWGGACAGTAPCTLAMTQARAVTTNFALVPETLTWTLAGTGTGAIAINPAGTSCGATCATLVYGQLVTVTPTPATGSTFTGWSGACTGTGTCTVAMTSAQSVTATFTLVPETLTWSTTGNGSGAIIASPAGTSCGAGCLTYSYGTSVTITPSPSTGSSFSTWAGACAGTGACTIAMTGARSLTVGYALDSYTLNASVSTGGTISSSPAGIACNGVTGCTASFLYGTAVNLTATPATGYTFTSWSGACSGASTCSLTISGNASVLATFTAITPTLTVTRAGGGTGTVTDSVGKINCGGACSATYAYAQVVTLTATPAAGSTFAGWSGACGGIGTCQVSMTQMQNATASFNVATYPISISRVGSGTGTVSGSGLSCGASCSGTFAYGTVISLSASPAGGNAFIGFSGPCSGAGTCTFTVGGAATVTAEFEPLYTLTVAAPLTGRWVGNGINCGVGGSGACSVTLPLGTFVDLGWVGKACVNNDGSGTQEPTSVNGCTFDPSSDDCTLTLTQSTTVNGTQTICLT